MAAPFGRKRAIFETYDLSGMPFQTQVGYVVALGQALRGEVGKPYMFAQYDVANFTEVMGGTTDLFSGPAEALNAIKNGANLIYIRVAHYTDIADASTCTATAASCLIPDRGGQPTHGQVVSTNGPFLFQLPVAGHVSGTELGGFTFALDTNDKFSCRIKHDGVWGAAQTVTFAAGVTINTAACEAINSQTNGLNASVVDNKVFLAAADPNDDIEILAVAHDSYSTIGLAEAVYSHTPGTNVLTVSIDGHAQTFTLAPLNGETSTFYLTSAQVVAQMTGLTYGTLSALQGQLTIASLTTGMGSTVQVDAGSTALSVFGFDSNVHAGIAGDVVNAWKYQLKAQGDFGNYATLFFYDSNLNPGTRMNVERRIPGQKTAYFKELSRDPNDPLYWKNYINMHDPYGDIVDVAPPNAAPYDWPALNSSGITFSGGSDGRTYLDDADWIGHPASKTGFYAIDSVQIPIIHWFCFGTTSAVVHQEAGIWCDARIAKFYHGAVPAFMDSADMVDWRMGNQPDYSHAAFDSPSVSLVACHPSIYDERNNGLESVSGLSYLAADITLTEQVYGPGIAPFGVKRGKCPGVMNLDFNVDQDDAAWDLLSVYNMNVVVTLRSSDANWGNEGTYLWGGYTTQRNPSKLQDWAISWLVKAYELRMLPLMQRYISDPNKPAVWGELRRELEPLLRDDLNNDKIAGYFLNCDDGAYFAGGDLKGATINTADTMDYGEYIFRILLKPYSQIGWPIAQMGIMRTGDPYATYAYMQTLPNYVRI